jgi:hypothetical protein
MKQSGLVQLRYSARGSVAARVVALLILTGVALAWVVGGQANAEPHPVRLRAASASRAERGARIQHKANVRRGAGAHAVAHHSSAVSRHAGGRRSNHAAVERATSAKTSAGRRHRGETEQERADALPVLHRVSARTRRRTNRHSVVQREIASSASETGLPGADGSVRDGKGTAASARGAYASGESHPDQNVGIAGAQTAAVASLAGPLPMGDAPAAPRRLGPSDLVGAPLGADRRNSAGSESLDAAADVNAPSRQELTAEVEQPEVLLGRYRNGRLIVPRPLKGSHEILVHQNVMADDEGLLRVQDDDDLRRMRATRQLVDLPESASLHMNPELGMDRRCARPWTVRFASDLAHAYYARFHQPLQVNSAVRTVAYQVRLRRVNGNAAGIDGESASPHLTGEALDFGKHGMSVEEIAWMRTYLLPLMQSGKLDVEEEFQQACFHISVYRNYQPLLLARRRSDVAQMHDPRLVRSTQHTIQGQ